MNKRKVEVKARAVLAVNLYFLRQSNNLSARDVADELGVDRSTYSHWEQATCSPNLDILVSLSRFYSVSVDDLLTKNLVNEWGGASV